MSSYNPTSTEAGLLAQVRARESSNNYSALISQATCTKLGQTNCTASGAYGFTDATWAWVAQQTGVGDPTKPAYQNSQSDQDTNALWLLRYAGGDINASIAWGGSAGSAVSSSAGAIVDLTGSTAGISTADVLNSLGVTDALSAAGVDLTDPQQALALGVGVVTAVAVLAWAVS